jgi:hypothetical protein
MPHGRQPLPERRLLKPGLVLRALAAVTPATWGGQLIQPQPLSIICPFKASSSQLIITNNCSRTAKKCLILFFAL